MSKRKKQDKKQEIEKDNTQECKEIVDKIIRDYHDGILTQKTAQEKLSALEHYIERSPKFTTYEVFMCTDYIDKAREELAD